MRTIPNMIVSAPMDEVELRNLMYTAQIRNHGPFSIRYPRGRGITPDWRKPFQEIPIGKGRRLRKGTDLAILSIGTAGNTAAEAIQQLEDSHVSIAHYDMRFVKPLDEGLLHRVFRNFRQVITVEDGTVMGGFGSAVLEFMADHGYDRQVKRLGVPDRFIEQGTQAELYKECGFDADGIVKAIQSLVKLKVLSRVS
jgi:1-deoxy-D-xylulose-5-phosphate synthase